MLEWAAAGERVETGEITREPGGKLPMDPVVAPGLALRSFAYLERQAGRPKD